MTVVTIYSKSSCPYCDQARAFFAANAIPVTEIKHDDAADRATLYDRLGLQGNARTVPQIIITEGGEDFYLGGAHALRISGIQSLFGRVAVSVQPAASVVVPADAAGVVAEEGHSCCE